MALTDENGGNGMIMPVQPMGGYGYGGFPMMGNYGGMGFGGDWAWILLLLVLGGNGWGGFGGFGGFGGMMGLGFDFPWLLNGQNQINANTNAGFDHAATQTALGNLSTAVNTGFSNAEVAACNRAMADQALSFNNQIADLNRSFDAQTAIAAGQTALQSQLAQCCCDNRLATSQLSALVQSENCADREALSNGIRDIITAQTAGTQRILDQLCNDKIDAKNEKIVELQNQVAMQNLAASQAAQTAQLVADNNAQTAALIQRIAPYPQPSFIVGNPYFSGFYGNNGYWNNGCGCGNNGFGFAG